MRAVLVFLLSLGGWAQVWDLTAMDWSWDGVHMLMVSQGQLYVGLAPEGRALRLLYVGFRLEWARFAGKDHLVFSAPLAEGGWGLWWGTLAEDSPALLYTSSAPLRWPTASWDGTQVAFVEDWDRLMVLDVRTGAVELAVGGAWPKATPEFTPQGLGLLFAGLLLHEGEGSWDLFYYDLRTRDLIQLTVDPYFDWCPRISPDGLWVAFVSNRGGAPDIWVLPLGAGEPFPVTADPWEDAFPAWSPDGSALSYASRRPQGWVFLVVGAY